MKAVENRNIKQKRWSIPIPMRAKIKAAIEALVKIKKLFRFFILSNHQEYLQLSCFPESLFLLPTLSLSPFCRPLKFEANHKILISS